MIKTSTEWESLDEIIKWNINEKNKESNIQAIKRDELLSSFKRDVNVYSSMNQSLMNQARSCAEHVIIRQFTEFWMRFLLVDLSFLLILEKSYHFISLL
jgi:hypothetical protein